VTQHATDLAVRKTITVDAPLERAFAVFTEGLATWWPMETHHIGAERPVTTVMEPRADGRCFERAADGTESDWGRVRVWEPPSRLVVAWHLSPEWTYDPDSATETEFEVRFAAEGPGRTRVDLEHRGFERYGERAEDVLAPYASEGGWSGLLGRYAQAVRA
jgi:uncharacterized protein YndB with AHSA1/START domain